MVKHEELTEIIEIKKTKFDFYCDECGEYIGTRIVTPDEVVLEPGIYEKNIFAGNKKLRIKRNLCDSCKEKIDESLRVALIGIGYEEV